MIVRIADKMGADVRKLVPFGPAGNTAGTAPTWARRAARSLARPIATPCG